MQSEKKWKKFERLSTAIHLVDTKGDVAVKWDEKIDGRQFDVIIKFRTSFYNYLTVIECKDYTKKISVDKVESFVTKSRDIGANKAIFVSSSGFQKGAITVAEKHHIELFTLEEINSFPEETLSNELIPALNIYNISFLDKNKRPIISLKEEENMLPYLLKNTIVKFTGGVCSPEVIINKYYKSILLSATTKEKKTHVCFSKGAEVTLPNKDKKIIDVSFFLFHYKLISARQTTTAGIDPNILPPSYRYKNLSSKEEAIFKPFSLHFGIDTILEEGKFYYNPNLMASYFCEEIKGDNVKMILVESYQHGMLFQATIVIYMNQAKKYVEIKNKKEIEYLTKMYMRYKNNSSSKK